ncbi:hypothetical protein F8388_002182 [Cannabis sativa]|uniref:SHSP domain-containing protein n=1 Tax=Cannabis sativa TaxID=3483 RepID=A0A7J6FU37_CANSA|nr:hypothetical protein F8388_002182 [Cannabis sativa]KAF4377440.1 hypothetical protein G4B88_026393 [Cannabis sativa]
MSSVPSPFRGRIGDPLDTYAIDVWDPLKDFSFFFPDYTSPTSAGEESSIPVPSQVKKEEIKVSGKEEKEKEIMYDEQGGGMFLRWFRLPENAKLDQAKAGMEYCGLLTMVVPKAEVKKLDVKAIQISGS